MFFQRGLSSHLWNKDYVGAGQVLLRGNGHTQMRTPACPSLTRWAAC